MRLKRPGKRLRNAGFGEDIFTAWKINFADIDKVVEKIGQVDFVLADLGVSSMQIDNPERGFSYKIEGPLDLRLNPNKGISAAQRLLVVTRDELEGMLVENADEPYAAQIARAVMKARKKKQKLETTTELRQLIEETLMALNLENPKQEIKKSCQRTFQALRIDVNSEFEVLETFLNKLPDVLAPGGRVAILTFHSGEDRLVKQAFKAYKKMGIYEDVAKEVIRPSAEECARNPRAKSTKMRWAIKAKE